jgi:hypothetical protein
MAVTINRMASAVKLNREELEAAVRERTRKLESIAYLDSMCGILNRRGAVDAFAQAEHVRRSGHGHRLHPRRHRQLQGIQRHAWSPGRRHRRDRGRRKAACGHRPRRVLRALGRRRIRRHPARLRRAGCTPPCGGCMRNWSRTGSTARRDAPGHHRQHRRRLVARRETRRWRRTAPTWRSTAPSGSGRNCWAIHDPDRERSRINPTALPSPENRQRSRPKPCIRRRVAGGGSPDGEDGHIRERRADLPRRPPPSSVSARLAIASAGSIQSTGQGAVLRMRLTRNG